jgi:uncharacterized protein (DUF305 family)
MEHTHENNRSAHKGAYRRLAVMTVFSFIAMYMLMYSMVDGFDNVIHNINQVYMAGLMTGAMVLIELLVMRSMYTDKKANAGWLYAGALVLVLCFVFIRKQAAVGDKEFVKSMIPHHAAAVLMVRETQLSDPELRQLAKDIISAQEKEIELMKRKLREMED